MGEADGKCGVSREWKRGWGKVQYYVRGWETYSVILELPVTIYFLLSGL